jgi:hypothetical protein
MGDRAVPQNAPAANRSAFSGYENGNAAQQHSDHGYSSLGPGAQPAGAAGRPSRPAPGPPRGVRKATLGGSSTVMRTLTFAAIVFAGACISINAAPPAVQRTFATPQEAAHALATAAEANDTAALLKILGPEGKDIVSSGDANEDKAGRAHFARLAAEKLQIRQDEANRNTILAGSQEWPFPSAAGPQGRHVALAGDNAWMLVSAALVLMMTGPGLALFYGGLVRRKNVLGTMMHSFILMAVVTVIWAVVGYSLVSAERHAVHRRPEVRLPAPWRRRAPNPDYAATIPQQTFMIYQLMFAIITPALISGAFAERMKFSAMLLFMVLWSLIVYFPMAHMVWGKGGLLNAFLGGKVPCFDFAGGTVVHITSGVSALVCALYLGKRVGYPRKAMKPHSWC